MAYWGFFYSFKMSSLRLIVLILHFQAGLLNEGYVSVILSEMLHLQEYNSFIHKTQLSWLYFLNYFPLRLYRLCSIIFWYFVFWNRSLREAWFCFFAENLLFFFCFLAIMLEPLVLFVTQLFALDGRVFLSFVFFFFFFWNMMNTSKLCFGLKENFPQLHLNHLFCVAFWNYLHVWDVHCLPSTSVLSSLCPGKASQVCLPLHWWSSAPFHFCSLLAPVWMLIVQIHFLPLIISLLLSPLTFDILT